MIKNKGKTLASYGRKQIFIALFILLFFALTTTSSFILRPFITNTADTIAGQLIAQTIKKQLSSQIHVDVNFPFSLTNPDKYRALVSTKKRAERVAYLPLLYLVKENLSQHFQQEVTLVAITKQPNFYWFQIKGAKQKNWQLVGFSIDLIGTQPELTLLFLAIFLIALAVIFSLLISKSMNSPLLALENMIGKLAIGDFSASLPAHELVEINLIFEQVNKLSVDIKNMLEQRVIFLAGISHDLRTPVTRLKLLLAIHEQALSTKYTEQANKALNEIEALVKIYLDAGQFLVDDDVGTVNLVPFIEEILNQFPFEQKNNIVITSEVIQIQAINSQALKRVLTNFIANAIKYAPAKELGDICVQIKKSCAEKTDNKSIAIIISDNGLGVEQAQLAEIYKPFYQAPLSKSDLSQTENQQINAAANNENNGLGLAICRQICLSQGWSLNIKNKNTPEHGLVVQLNLPYAK